MLTLLLTKRESVNSQLYERECEKCSHDFKNGKTSRENRTQETAQI